LDDFDVAAFHVRVDSGVGRADETSNDQDSQFFENNPGVFRRVRQAGAQGFEHRLLRRPDAQQLAGAPGNLRRQIPDFRGVAEGGLAFEKFLRPVELLEIDATLTGVELNYRF
jgi:hypothetical protein